MIWVVQGRAVSRERKVESLKKVFGKNEVRGFCDLYEIKDEIEAGGKAERVIISDDINISRDGNVHVAAKESIQQWFEKMGASVPEFMGISDHVCKETIQVCENIGMKFLTGIDVGNDLKEHLESQTVVTPPQAKTKAMVQSEEHKIRGNIKELRKISEPSIETNQNNADVLERKRTTHKSKGYTFSSLNDIK